MRRINAVKYAAVPSPQKKKRVSKPRDYYSDFATSKELGVLDDYLDDEIVCMYPWCAPQRMGGSRYSLRLRLQKKRQDNFQSAKSMMMQSLMSDVINDLKSKFQPVVQPAQPAAASAQPGATTQPDVTREREKSLGIQIS